MFGILVIALFFMGLEIDMKIIWEVLKKPIGPCIGLVCQFVFMPLCTYGLAKGILLNGKIKAILKIMSVIIYYFLFMSVCTIFLNPKCLN